MNAKWWIVTTTGMGLLYSLINPPFWGAFNDYWSVVGIIAIVAALCILAEPLFDK